MIFLQQLFSHICGQQHYWGLGGQTLPFCQRCTGLYVGAFIAMILISTFRLHPTRALYWLHGAFLLLMIPYGFHLVPQGSFLRTATGFLFAFGLVYFLTLNPFALRRWWRPDSHPRTIGYVLLIPAELAVLLVILYSGGPTWAIVVAAMSTLGLVALCLLVLANLATLPGTLHQLTRASRAGAA